MEQNFWNILGSIFSFLEKGPFCNLTQGIHIYVALLDQFLEYILVNSPLKKRDGDWVELLANSWPAYHQ